MARKELRKLKRRELLEMLLVQCQETERVQRESARLRERYDEMSESYERLKKKLDIKDERLNQKDAKLAEMRQELAELKQTRALEVEEVGSITEATLKLNEMFEENRRMAEQYLLRIGKLREGSNVVSMNFGQKQREGGQNRKPAAEEQREPETRSAAATGELYVQ